MITFIQVIRQNTTLPQAHEMKRRALKELGRYNDIIKTPDGRQYIMIHL